jgi:hypothetical protein
MGFPRGTKLFINDHQSPNMRTLSYNARMLKRDGLVAETWFSNAAVRIKLTPTSKPIKLTHERDFVDHFPTYRGFTFDMDFYDRLREDADIEKYDDCVGNWSDDGLNDSKPDTDVNNPLAKIPHASSSSPISEEMAQAKQELLRHVALITKPPSDSLSQPPPHKPLQPTLDVNSRRTRSQSGLTGKIDGKP